MVIWRAVVSIVLVSTGALFFLAGTIGMLRFPTLHARLHALTKADNLGLGFVVVGLVAQANDVWVAAKLLLIWALTLSAGGTAAFLIARHAHRRNAQPS